MSNPHLQDVLTLVRTAPAEVRVVYRDLTDNDSAAVIQGGVPLIQPLAKVAPAWAGTLAAWVGFSYMVDGEAENAMTFRDVADRLGYNAAGTWYALCGRMLAADALDDMDMAFVTANKAVDVFVELESWNYVSLASRRRANFCKQLCARTYRTPDLVPRIAPPKQWQLSKMLANEGLNSLALALSVSEDPLDDDEIEDAEALFRQAALFGLRVADMAFLDVDAAATEALGEHVSFDDGTLARTGVSMHWNLAIDARKAGQREVAEHYFAALLAIDIPDVNEDDLAYRGMTLYHRGVNLLKHADFENAARIPEEKAAMAKRIRHCWHEFLEIYRNLPAGYAHEFGKRMDFDAERATKAVREDRLMGFVCMVLADGMLVPLL